MTLQDLGAIGETVGGIAVVVSLVYVAFQIRQNSRQIEQNSRHLEASMYYATNDAFYRWFAMLAGDENLAALWRRVVAGETLEHEDRTRAHALLTMLFLSYENNFQQFRIGAVKRDALDVASSPLRALLSRQEVRAWWVKEAPRTLTPEFRREIEALLAEADSGRDEPRHAASARTGVL